MSTVTQWFKGEDYPYHHGIYQRQYYDDVIFSRWDGVRWHLGARTAQEASTNVSRSLAQYLPWRGLATAPEDRQP